VDIKHQKLKHGDRCPECGKGNVYGQKEPKVLVRIVGQALLAATVYSLERLRCGACGQVFTAQEPEGVGADKYDETAAAMIAQLKYGAGTPFYRLEQLESQLGIPLPAATQWEIVEEEAQVIKPARDELIRQAAQGTVVHNDDTGMRVLMLKAIRPTIVQVCSPAGSCRSARTERSRSTLLEAGMLARTSQRC
jgi:transposase